MIARVDINPVDKKSSVLDIQSESKKIRGKNREIFIHFGAVGNIT